MRAVQNKLSHYEQVHAKMSNRLDTLAQLMNELELNRSKHPNPPKPQTEESKFPSFLEDDSSYQNQLTNDLNQIMTKVNDNIISTNYLNFYDFLLSRRPHPPPKPQPITESPIEYAEASTQVDLRRRSLPQKINLSLLPSQIPITINSDAKNLLHKKQNAFLTNELTSLKCKLNKLKNDNERLNMKVRSQQQVKNFKFLEKFINSFVEKLSINWNDIVEEIIDELLIQEVYELNSIELDKMKYNELKLTTFADVLQNAPTTKETKFNFLFDSLDEVSAMISDVKNKEMSISKKYNLNI